MYSVKMITTEQEALDLVSLARDHHQELASHLPFDEVYALTNSLRIAGTKDKSAECAWVAYKDDLPVGYFIGHIGPYYFTPMKSANQTLWYVSIANRASRVAMLMFNTFEDWAMQYGCVEIYAGAWSHDLAFADKINRIYPRMGYDHVGAFYVKQINSNKEIK